MFTIVTDSNQNVLACLPDEENERGILANNIRAYRAADPVFTEEAGGVIRYYPDKQSGGD